jgi:hypothetical protein
MFKTWEKSVKENEDADGAYIPTPLSSVHMALACEVDANVQRLPGSRYSLYPEDVWTWVVHGDDDYAIGWISYFHFRYINCLGWTSVQQQLTKVPYVDNQRVARFMDDDATRRVQEVRRSAANGVRVVVQTSADPLDEFALRCLTQGGDLYYLTVFPVEPSLITSLKNCFKEVSLVRAYWSTPIDFPIVMIVGKEYSGDPVDFLKKIKSKKTIDIPDQDRILQEMIDQQTYITSLNDTNDTGIVKQTSPMFLKFLKDGFPTWNI